MKKQILLLCVSSLITMFFCSQAYSQSSVSGGLKGLEMLTANASIALINKSGHVVDRTTTQSGGSFRFRNVRSGDYYLGVSGQYIKSFDTRTFTVSAYGRDDLYYNAMPSAATLSTILYVAAYSGPDEFPQIVTELSSIITSETQFFQCLDNTANMLIRGSINDLISNNDARERALGIGNAAGVPPDISLKAANDIAGSSAQLFMFGKSLNDVSRSVKGILEGNSSIFYQTDLYKLAKFSRSLMDQYKPFASLLGMDIEAIMQWSNQITFAITHMYISAACN